MKKWTKTFLVAACAAGCAFVAQAQIVGWSDAQVHSEGLYNNLKANTDVAYKTVDGRELNFDISYPQAEPPKEGFPLIVYFHGGAWSGGKRTEGYGLFNDEIRFYNSKGIAVATVTYRLINSSNKLTIKDCVIDTKDALRFMIKNSRQLGVNPDKIGVYGHSAGGHLTLMVALGDDSKFIGEPSLKDVNVKVSCAVPMSAPTSFIDPEANDLGTYQNNPSLMAGVLGGSYDMDKTLELRTQISPTEYLSKNSPRILRGHTMLLTLFQLFRILNKKYIHTFSLLRRQLFLL